MDQPEKWVSGHRKGISGAQALDTAEVALSWVELPVVNNGLYRKDQSSGH